MQSPIKIKFDILYLNIPYRILYMICLIGLASYPLLNRHFVAHQNNKKLK